MLLLFLATRWRVMTLMLRFHSSVINSATLLDLQAFKASNQVLNCALNNSRCILIKKATRYSLCFSFILKLNAIHLMNSLYQKDWKCDHNPPYSYYLYRIFVNMTSLNNWREERGLNAFVLRPHFGETGDTGLFGCCFSDFAR